MTPDGEYASRLTAREATVRGLERIQERVGAVRLVLVALLIVLAWSSWGEQWLSPLWMLLPAAGFLCAVVYHAGLRRRHSRAGRAAGFYRRGLARLEDRWAGTGNKGERFGDIHHVYGADLDLFGEGSLFELLCAVKTRMGEETLARWLLAPAAVAEIRRRQTGVLELRDRLDLRERIGMLGSEPEPVLHPDRLLTWAEAPRALGEGWIGWAAYLLPALLIASSVIGELTGFWTPLLLVLTAQAITLYRLRDRLQQILVPAERAFDLDGLKTGERPSANGWRPSGASRRSHR